MSAETVPELKTASQLAAEVQGTTEQDVVQDDVDPKDQREYTFEFDYTDARGKQWKDKFTNQILSIRQRQQVKIIKAQLGGGIAVSALDADIWTLNEMVAHMTVSLIKRPDWAKELTSLLDENLIEALYEEVASHEAQFHGREASVTAGPVSDKDRTG